jgi:ubiquitin C-terminal hydrolase
VYNNDNDMSQLQSLVSIAERERASKNTTALQEYMDNHPQLSAITLNMTEEIKQKLVMYIGNADKKAQETLQGELDELGRHLANLSENPNILHQLLCEEVLVSYLMLRCSDVMYTRHHGSLTSMALRKSDAAHVRLMRSIRTLASIQKITQFVNVNLGQQIVNNG